MCIVAMHTCTGIWTCKWTCPGCTCKVRCNVMYMYMYAHEAAQTVCSLCTGTVHCPSMLHVQHYYFNCALSVHYQLIN